ncbi:MAG: CHAT domain-containing protein [Clostridia bacterium]|nr:CHAT domain-containing protein [Clostridia bacterium]
MKTKKLVVALSFLLSFIILMIAFGANTFVASAETAVLNLNEKRAVTINANEVKIFYFTPNSNQHYVVETFGTQDTKLRVSNIPAGEIINGGRYTDDNARIWFKAEQGRQIKIELKLYRAGMSGSTTIQIRKQRFSMFSVIDQDGDSTAKDLNTPYDKFKNLYETVKYENASYSEAFKINERGLTAFNSEIVFFSGHGASNGICFMKNKVCTGDLSTNTRLNMSSTRVAMFSSCESAKEDDSNSLCIARYAVVSGAYASVGFQKEVSFSSARKFTNKFFTKLSEGYTVYEAASKGKGAIIWAWDNAKKYTVFGRGEITVVSDSASASTFSIKQNVDLEYLREELASGYIAEPLSETETRYYQTVNGYLTDSYIDITEENGRIVDYDDRRKAFDSVLEIEGDYLNKGCAEIVCADGSVYNLKAEREEHIVYCNLDGVMTPVKVSFASYVNEHGCAVYEASCINLNNGEAIDYGDISGEDDD